MTGQEGPATEALGKVETLARVTEAAAHAGFLARAGELAKPLLHGKLKRDYIGGALGMAIILPEIINRLPLPKKSKRVVSIAASAISLIGGFALRSVFVAVGKPSADNPDDARLATGAKGGAL